MKRSLEGGTSNEDQAGSGPGGPRSAAHSANSMQSPAVGRTDKCCACDDVSLERGRDGQRRETRGDQISGSRMLREGLHHGLERSSRIGWDGASGRLRPALPPPTNQSPETSIIMRRPKSAISPSIAPVILQAKQR